MTITLTTKGDYLASYRGMKAYGFSFTEAIINLMTLMQ